MGLSPGFGENKNEWGPAFWRPVVPLLQPFGTISYSLSSAYPLLKTSSETRYGRIDSFRNSLFSRQGKRQVRRYIPGITGLGLMPGEVTMKCTFRHLSHTTPIWIGMGGDYGTINPKRMLGPDLSNLAFGVPVDRCWRAVIIIYRPALALILCP